MIQAQPRSKDRGVTGPTPAVAGTPRRRGWALRACFIGMVTLGINQPLAIASVPVSDLVFMFGACAVAAGLMQGRVSDLANVEMRRTPPLILAAAMVLLTVGVLSSLWSLDPTGSIASVIRFAWTTLIWLWLLRAVCPTRAELLRLVHGFKITLFISCAAAVAGQLGLISTSPANYEQRQAGFYGHPNDLAGLLAVGLPFVLLTLPQGPSPKASYDWLVRLAFVGVLLFAIASTGSMTGIFAMFVGGLVMGALRLAQVGLTGWFRRPMRTVALGLAGSIALIALVGSDLPLFERITRLSEGDGYVQGSITAREDLNAYVLGNFDQFLVLGIGPTVGEISKTSELGYTVALVAEGGVHNMYLKTLLEFGLFGLLALVAILLTLGRRCLWLTQRARNPEVRSIAAACFASLCAAMTFALFSPIAFQRYFWVPAGFIGALLAIARQEARTAARGTVAPGHAPPGPSFGAP